MTREDYAKLTDEEKNERIQRTTGEWRRWYLNDLNAMHEAEQSMPQDVRYSTGLGGYLANLWLVCGEPTEPRTEYAEWSALIFATAAQRAEAFVLTMMEGE